MGKWSGKYYYIVLGAAFGIPGLIYGLYYLFDNTANLFSHMATFGFGATGILSGYVAFRLLVRYERQKSQRIRRTMLIRSIWDYHDEHPKVTAKGIRVEFEIDSDEAKELLALVKDKKAQGYILNWGKGIVNGDHLADSLNLSEEQVFCRRQDIPTQDKNK